MLLCSCSPSIFNTVPVGHKDSGRVTDSVAFPQDKRGVCLGHNCSGSHSGHWSWPWSSECKLVCKES